MDLCPSSEVNIFPATAEILRLLCNQNVH